MSNKKYKSGLVIGKFYPPHKGHKYLIDMASSQVKHLTVIVCDKKNYQIFGQLRAKWISEIHPKVEVKLVFSKLKDYDTLGWAKSTIDWLGYVPDVVFSSEDYGEGYAKAMGCIHVLVDKERKIIPCSGRKIRRNPYKYWHFLEPCVRSYFVKRVVLVGAESTGKTTICKNLAEYYQTKWVPEYGRELAERKLKNNDSFWVPEEFEQIALEQTRREEEAARSGTKLIICDTDAFATCLWQERYLGFLSAEVEKIAINHRPDLYLLTDTDIPFVQDGTRDGEKIRRWMHERFVQELNKQKRPFVLLSGNKEERFEKGKMVIDKLLKINGINLYE